MIYRARYIITMTGNIIPDGAIYVQNGIIKKIDKYENIKKTSTEEIVDCRPLVFMPGLINSHVHLEEGMLRLQSDPPTNFTSWYTRTSKYFSQSDIIKRFNAIRLGCKECLTNGTTFISDTTSTRTSFLVFREEQIRSHVFIQFKELTPSKAQAHFDEIKKNLSLLDFIYPLSNIGLSPHSPYTSSAELYKLAIKMVKDKNILYQTHIAESSEELEMFCSESGPLYEYSERLQNLNLRDYKKGPMSFMLLNGLLPRHSIVIHGNYLSGEEFEALSRRKASIVHCAQSHSFFGHKRFPFETALSRGVNICLGTESLASSSTLNLFDDINLIKRQHPSLDSELILKFATVNGAYALGMENKTGVLKQGAFADIIGIRISCNNIDELYDEIVLGDPTVEFVMVNGEEIIS